MAGEFEEVVIHLRGGLHNSSDPSSIARDELVEAEGIEFRPTRKGLFGLPGRVSAGSVAATAAGNIFAMNYMSFDNNFSVANMDPLVSPRWFMLWTKGAGATAVGFLGTADDDGQIVFNEVGYTLATRFSNTATAHVDALHYANVWYMWNGANRNLATLEGSLDTRLLYHSGLLAVTASGTATVSGSGSDFSAGDYQAWWVQSDTINIPDLLSAYTGTPSDVTVSSGEKIVLTFPATAVQVLTPDGVSNAAWYLTSPGGKYPNGFRVTDPGFVFNKANIAIITALDTSIPYRIAGPLGGAAVSSDTPPPNSFDMVVFNDSLVAIDGEDRQLVKFSLPDEVRSWPVINVIKFDTAFQDKLNALAIVNNILLVFSSYYVFRLLTLPRHTNPDDITNARGKVKKKFIEGHGAVSPRGVLSISTPTTGEICLFICRDGIHATNGQNMTYAIPNFDWFANVDLDNLDRYALLDNPKNSRVEFYYIDKSGDFRRLDIYYHPTLVTRNEAGAVRFPILGPHPVPGLQPTLGLLGGEFREWSASGQTVYLEGTGTTDNALLVDSGGTINKRWKTKDFYFGGINADFGVEKVYAHQAQVTASGTYTVTGTFRTDDSTPFTATATIDQTLKNAQPLHFLNA